jgi:hypothetical protein
MTTTNILLLAIFIALLSFSPKPTATDADLEAFQKFCRWVWRAVVVTAKLTVLMIAVAVLWYNVGTQNMVIGFTMAFVCGIFGFAGFRILLWVAQFVIPDDLHRYLDEKTDPDRLLSYLDKY